MTPIAFLERRVTMALPSTQNRILPITTAAAAIADSVMASIILSVISRLLSTSGRDSDPFLLRSFSNRPAVKNDVL